MWFACREAVTPRRDSVLVLDDLVYGHRELVKEAELVAGDMEARRWLETFLRAYHRSGDAFRGLLLRR